MCHWLICIHNSFNCEFVNSRKITVGVALFDCLAFLLDGGDEGVVDCFVFLLGEGVEVTAAALVDPDDEATAGAGGCFNKYANPK